MSARKLFTSVKQLPSTLFFTMITLYWKLSVPKMKNFLSILFRLANKT